MFAKEVSTRGGSDLASSIVYVREELSMHKNWNNGETFIEFKISAAGRPNDSVDCSGGHQLHAMDAISKRYLEYFGYKNSEDDGGEYRTEGEKRATKQGREAWHAKA